MYVQNIQNILAITTLLGKILMSASRAWSLGSRNLWLLRSLWFPLVNVVRTVMRDL